VACIGETFSGGIGRGSRGVATHPLVRAVYDVILADEARHERFGTLYFEWAQGKLDDAERARLGEAAGHMLRGLRRYWAGPENPVEEGRTAREGWRVEDLHALGSLESARFVPHARKVILEEVIAPLDAVGIHVPTDVRAALT
jgi:hypothetical protein